MSWTIGGYTITSPTSVEFEKDKIRYFEVTEGNDLVGVIRGNLKYKKIVASWNLIRVSEIQPVLNSFINNVSVSASLTLDSSTPVNLTVSLISMSPLKPIKLQNNWYYQDFSLELREI